MERNVQLSNKIAIYTIIGSVIGMIIIVIFIIGVIKAMINNKNFLGTKNQNSEITKTEDTKEKMDLSNYFESIMNYGK